MKSEIGAEHFMWSEEVLTCSALLCAGDSTIFSTPSSDRAGCAGELVSNSSPSELVEAFRR